MQKNKFKNNYVELNNIIREYLNSNGWQVFNLKKFRFLMNIKDFFAHFFHYKLHYEFEIILERRKKMNKILLIILLGVSCCVALHSTNDICSWKAKRDALIQKLSPPGQKIANQILIDLQAISFAGIQPLYAYIGVRFNLTLNSIKSSPSDASKLAQLEYLYGAGNWSAGLGSLRDDCQVSKNIANVVATMSTANQKLAISVIKEVEAGLRTILPVLLAVNRFLDDSLYRQLTASENSTTLTALNALYGIK